MITRSKTKMGENGEQDLRQIVESIRADMVTNERIDELMSKINEKDVKIAELEERIAYLEKSNSLLERCVDDNESYGRRQNLRIVGIPPPELGIKETADDVCAKVKEAIVALNLPDATVDRAHRVGKRFGDDKGSPVHPVIVRFTSWKARTAVYRKRVKRGQVRFYVDLTKRRFDLKKKATARVENIDEVHYVFADVNNNIGLRLTNGQLKFFNSVQELESILVSLVVN